MILGSEVDTFRVCGILDTDLDKSQRFGVPLHKSWDPCRAGLRSQTLSNMVSGNRYLGAGGLISVLGHAVDEGRGRGDLHPPRQYLQHRGLRETSVKFG